MVETKTCYDYLLLILPIALGALSTIGGWIFYNNSNKKTFLNELRKEEYNGLKDSLKCINDSFIKLYEYCNSFINKTRDLYMKNMEMSEYDLSEFSSNKMLKISDIFNRLEIDFPEIKYNQKEYMNISNGFELFFTKLRNIKGQKDKIEIYVTEITNVCNVLSDLNKISNELLSQLKKILSNSRLQLINNKIKRK